MSYKSQEHDIGVRSLLCCEFELLWKQWISPAHIQSKYILKSNAYESHELRVQNILPHHPSVKI